MNGRMIRAVSPATVFATLVFLAITSALAIAADQGNDDIRPSSGDYAAAREARSTRHVKPSNTERGLQLHALRGVHAAPNRAQNSGHVSDQARYPGDLQYHGGNVIDFTQFHAVYLKPSSVCPTVAACWGNPEGFLDALGESQLIHVVDQYVGHSGNNRYSVGSHKFVNFTLSKTPLTDTDIQAYVHSIAQASGNTGYGHLYHVFLPPGQDECFDSTFAQCYSPDNLASFAFCAYHSSAVFKDIGEVVYSVEPYQNTPGCQDEAGTPNGQLVDSTNDTLSHETIEAITDPDGDAWWNSVGLGMLGQEIGDECIFITPDGFAIPNIFTVDGKKYATQPEYSNEDHGCVIAP